MSQSYWHRGGSGAWETATNWDPSSSFPNDNTATATFGSAITSARTVITDSDVTVKGIRFDNNNTYAIAGIGSGSLPLRYGWHRKFSSWVLGFADGHARYGYFDTRQIYGLGGTIWQPKLRPDL